MDKEIASLRARFAEKAIVLIGYENMQFDELSLNGKITFDGVLRIGCNHFEGATLTSEEAIREFITEVRGAVDAIKI